MSIGLGRSKLIAKLASEAGKPHGWTVITAEQEDDFLLPTPVGKLWGVGPATETVLHGIGVRTVAQLRETPQADLVRLLGVAHGNGLHRLAFGIDERPVENDRETKSISAERTFAFDITGREAHGAELNVVFGHARRRLMRHGGGARTVTVKARFSDFTTVTRAVSLRQPTTDPRALLTAAEQALRRPPRPESRCACSASASPAWSTTISSPSPSTGRPKLTAKALILLRNLVSRRSRFHSEPRAPSWVSTSSFPVWARAGWCRFARLS